jgi:hypothetical protein
MNKSKVENPPDITNDDDILLDNIWSSVPSSNHPEPPMLPSDNHPQLPE